MEQKATIKFNFELDKTTTKRTSSFLTVVTVWKLLTVVIVCYVPKYLSDTNDSKKDKNRR